MKVLVTGGTGFVGPAVVRAIVDAGHDVRALARTEKSAATAAVRTRPLCHDCAVSVVQL